MEEIWRDICGYEGYYQVSNYGRVKRLGRLYWNVPNESYSFFPENILCGHYTPKGYKRVLLSKDCKQKKYLVHRLVATAFIPNPNNLPQVNHKDEDKTNNFVYVNEDGTVDLEKSNLEWCDNKYNCNYGTQRKEKLTKGRRAVLQYDLQGNFIKEYEGIKKAEQETHVWSSSISLCCRGLCESRGGFIWRYSETQQNPNVEPIL